MPRVITDNFFQLLGGLVVFFAGVGVMASALDIETQARQQALRAVQNDQADVWLAEQAIDATVAKANQRYQRGCIVLDIQINEGTTVTSIKAGERVCDRVGITALVGHGGLVTDLARTYNTDIISERLQQL